MTTILKGSVIAQDAEIRHLSGILVAEGYKVERQGLKVQVVDRKGKKSSWLEAYPLRGFVRKMLSNQTAFELAFRKAGIK